MSATYNYRAMNEMGRMIKGEIIADNEVDLEARLNELGLDLVDYSEAKQRKANRFSRVKNQDMVIMCLHLEQLGRAGVPLLEAIADVRDSAESDKLRDVMTGVYEAVKGGELFSEALGQHPKIFDEVFVGLIRAGEKTGDMSEVYKHLADHFKWTHELKRKIKKAIRYPLFLLFVMSVVISVLMIFVVPKLVDFIVSQGFHIPIHTKALIAVSEAFVDFWWLILGLPVFLIVGISFMYRVSEPFAFKIDSLSLKLPVLGPTIRKINMARFTHFFSVMFKSGIDILDSLEGSRRVVSNRELSECIEVVKRSVSEGSSLTAALRMSNQFPTMVVRMFNVGENSGNMNSALENVKFFYDKEVNDAVDTLVGMIQPALTLLMGMLIFWVISAVFGPLYESFSKMPF